MASAGNVQLGSRPRRLVTLERLAAALKRWSCLQCSNRSSGRKKEAVKTANQSQIGPNPN